MTKINDGGPAFPREDYGSEACMRGQGGMSLREYAAIHLASGLVQAHFQKAADAGVGVVAAMEGLSRLSIAAADALLAELAEEPSDDR